MEVVDNMTKMRVHELAKELGVENKTLMEALEKKQVEVKSHMSSLEENVVEELKKEFAKKTAANAENAAGEEQDEKGSFQSLIK